METVQDEKGYNGWKNYETWVTALWIDNDEGSHAWSRAMAADCRGADYPRSALADTLRSGLEDEAPDLGASVWADLLGHALETVDWYEIAENYLSEAE